MNSQHMSLKSLRVLVFLSSFLCLAPLGALSARDVAHPSAQEELVRNNLAPFAGAYKEVKQISTIYAQLIIQSADRIQADALQQEAHQKMNQAVADHGLSVEDYNSIFRAIQSDPVLQEEFMTVLHQVR